MLRLRQIALMTADLERARAEFFAVLGIKEAFEDPTVGEFGLRNFILTLGDTFIEVLTPIKAGTAASRFLERHGDGGYMLMVQTSNLAAASQRAKRLGIRKTWEKHLPDAGVFHMHPKDTGGAILSFDEMVPVESWAWAGPGWQERAADYVRNIDAVDVLSPDPEDLARRWEQLFEREALMNINHVWRIPFDQGTVRIHRAPAATGEGIHAIEMVARDRAAALIAATARNLPIVGDTVTICGVQFRFVGP
jgi:hypothetical protein